MPGWHWPDDVPKEQPSEPAYSTPRQRHAPATPPAADEAPPPREKTRSRERTQTSGRRHWGPRQCRICLDTVQPTFEVPSEFLPGFLQSAGQVKYEDENGRLIRPCLCKGSSKYVHEGCLQAWRHADPSYGRRNYYQCPTCGFKYRLARLSAGRQIASVGKFPAISRLSSCTNDRHQLPKSSSRLLFFLWPSSCWVSLRTQLSICGSTPGATYRPGQAQMTTTLTKTMNQQHGGNISQKDSRQWAFLAF